MQNVLDFAEVRRLLARIDELNKLDLRTCKFKDGTASVYMPPEIIEEFRFTGLNNVDFVRLEFWEKENES